MAQLVTSTTAGKVHLRQIDVNTGAGLFAVENLEPGDAVISIDRPLLTALDVERLEDTCYACHRQIGQLPIEIQLGFQPCPLIRNVADSDEVKLSRCAGCKTVRYCSKACQKSSWIAHHSLECPIFKEIYPRSVPNHVRAIVRLLLLKKAERVHNEDWKALMACSSHREHFSKDNKREELANLKHLTKMIVSFMPFQIEDDIALGLLMRLKINSLTLQTPFNDPIGLALHPFVAKVNHSCDPNCYVRFLDAGSQPQHNRGTNPGPMILTPLRKIAQDEEITISYIEETMPVKFRNHELKQRYFFDCRCQKCTSEYKVEAQLEPVTQAKLGKVYDHAKGVLEDVDQFVPTELRERHVKHWASEISRLFNYDENWPLHRYPFPQLLHQLILVHIDAQDFVSAFELAALRCFQVDPNLYSSPIYPLQLTHTLLLVKLMGGIQDCFLSENTTGRTEALKLANEIDLDFLHTSLTETLINDANKTWKEQPWPWMKETLEQLRSANVFGAAYSRNTELQSKEKARLQVLNEKTIQVLRYR